MPATTGDGGAARCASPGRRMDSTAWPTGYPVPMQHSRPPTVAPFSVNQPPLSLCGSRSGVQGPDPRSMLRSVDPPRPPCGDGVDDKLGAALSAKPLQHDAAFECRLQTAAFSYRRSIVCPDGLLDLGDLLRDRRIVDRPDRRVGPSGEHALGPIQNPVLVDEQRRNSNHSHDCGSVVPRCGTMCLTV